MNYLNREFGFCYSYPNDRYKLYFPFEFPQQKHLHNTKANDVFMTVDRGDKLIICSSPKDALSIASNRNCTTAAFNSESVLPSSNFIAYMKQKFKRIILLYDNDEAGISYMQQHSKALSIPFAILPKGYGKDPAEVSYNYNTEKLKCLLDKATTNLFNK
jgi:5S rRNA maturation endonuclease (ribonuclease M5)